MEFIFLALGWICLALGLLGCFVYKVPGPILSFIGILILQYATKVEPFSTTAIIICAIAVVVCKILEKQAPKLIAKIHPFGKGGKIGAMIGSIIGLILIVSVQVEATAAAVAMIIVALLIVPFMLSFVGEFIAEKDAKLALKKGTAAFSNYMVNTLLQLAVCGYCIYAVINA